MKALGRKTRSSLLLGPAALLAVALLSGCSPPAGEKETPQVYNVALMGDPVSIDPLYVQDANGLEITRQLFDGLTDYDPETMEVVPAVAGRWQSNEDASVWTFYLREDANFHDGTEVTAEDFKYAWERVIDPVNASDGAYHFAPIVGFAEMRAKKSGELEGVKVLGERRLEVRLTGPNADFPAVVGHPVFSPVPAHLFEEHEGERRFRDRIVGNGPFKLGEWKREQFILLERWDGYWRGKAHLDKIVFNIYADEDQAFEDFDKGVLHETEIPLGELKRLRVDPEYKDRLAIRPMLGVYYYALNQARAPWKGRPALGRAVALALDRARIANTRAAGAQVPATGLIPEGVPGFQPQASPYLTNLAQARRAMAASGALAAGRAVTLTYGADGNHLLAAQDAADDLAEAGFSPRLQALPLASYLDQVRAGGLSMFHFGWIADYPTLENFLFPAFYSQYRGRTNVAFYAHPQTDALLLEARRTLDPKLRRLKYRQIEKKILAEAAVVPVYFYRTKRVIQLEVRGYVRTALDGTPYERVRLAPSVEGAEH